MLTPLGRGSWLMFALYWAGKVVYGYSPLGDLVSGLLPTGGEGELHKYPPLGEWVGLYVFFRLGEKVGCMITPSWGRGWVFGLLPTGDVGLMVTSHWGSWFQGYSQLEERVGCMITPHWGRGVFWVTSRCGSWFDGYFPLGKLVSGLLPAGGEGGLHDYSLLGERVRFWVTSHREVGLMVTSCWGSWFNGYFRLGKLVSGLLVAGGVYDHFSLGMLGFMVTSKKKIKRKEEISQKDKEKSKGRQD